MKIHFVKYRKSLLIISLLALLGIGLAYASWEIVGSNICPDSGANEMSQQEIKCLDFYFDSLFYPFFFGFFLKSIIISSLILLLFSQRVFNIWKWFALIFIPLAFILIIFPLHEPGGIMFDKRVTSDLFGYLFLIITVLIALIVTGADWLKKRRK